MRLLNVNRTGSSRSQINIKYVADGVLVFSPHHYRLVLETSSINFELKSEAEQDALIETYQNFINSIGYPIQIIVRIRELDLDDYLTDISFKSKIEPSAIWRAQLTSYSEFVRSLVSVNKILTRNFYVVIPFDATGKQEFESAKEQLSLRAEIVAKGLHRLGMHVRQLSSLEVLNLFYSFYNPAQAKLQQLSEAAATHIGHSVIGADK